MSVGVVGLTADSSFASAIDCRGINSRFFGILKTGKMQVGDVVSKIDKIILQHLDPGLQCSY